MKQVNFLEKNLNLYMLSCNLLIKKSVTYVPITNKKCSSKTIQNTSWILPKKILEVFWGYILRGIISYQTKLIEKIRECLVCIKYS